MKILMASLVLGVSLLVVSSFVYKYIHKEDLKLVGKLVGITVLAIGWFLAVVWAFLTLVI